MAAGGSSTWSWKPMVTANKLDLHYWLHWQVATCALSVLACMALAIYLIWRHEGPSAHRRHGGAGGDSNERRPGVLYNEEVWRPCLPNTHPSWLLAYRLIAFVLFSLLSVMAICHDNTLLYYYTQWTLILVAIYFGLGTALSIYGCCKFFDRNVGTATMDVEHGTITKRNLEGEDGTREVAGFCGYLLQILYQTNAGAVMLTDCVFWFIIFPFLVIRDKNPNFLKIMMHSVNVVFLLGEAALNSLRFPWFRITYFFLWTALYVIFQWIVHASTPIWWPYQFLDLSSSLAPLWYFLVGFMQFPCYIVFKLLIKLKHHLLSKWFPGAFVHCVKTDDQIEMPHALTVEYHSG